MATPVYGAQIVIPNVNLNSTTYDMDRLLCMRARLYRLLISQHSSLTAAYKANGYKKNAVMLIIHNLFNPCFKILKLSMPMISKLWQQENKTSKSSEMTPTTNLLWSTNSPEYNQNRGGWACLLKKTKNATIIHIGGYNASTRGECTSAAYWRVTM